MRRIPSCQLGATNAWQLPVRSIYSFRDEHQYSLQYHLRLITNNVLPTVASSGSLLLHLQADAGVVTDDGSGSECNGVERPIEQRVPV